MTAFLLDNELSDSLAAARVSSNAWLEPVPEYERLASNQPSPDLPDEYPKVTDGTMAGLIEEQPMRIWGKLQTGRVVGSPLDGQDFDEWKTEVVNVYWVNKIIPNANTTANFFEKLKVADEKAEIYGGQPLFVFPYSNDDYTGSDFSLPYVKDVKFEPGKVSDRDCNHIWLAKHYTKLALRDIIDSAKDAKDNAGWDIAALQKIVDSDVFSPRSDDLHRDQERNVDMGKTVTFYTCYQRGYMAPWQTIYPDGTDDVNNVIRREKNNNITGDIPIMMYYRKQNFINPYGVSVFELAGPGQNMLDYMTAAHGYGIQQALDPTLTVSGDPSETGVDLDTLFIAPRNIMFTGDSKVDWFTPDKGILQAFPDQLASYKTNVLNLVGTNDGTVSGASSGNTMYSKVPASIKTQNDRRSARDNVQRQVADEVLARLAKLMINIAIQNSDGSDVINITEEQRAKLVSAGYDVPQGAKEILAEFGELKTAVFKYEVDPGSSKFEDDDATKARIIEAIEAVNNIPDVEEKLRRDGDEIHWGELVRGLLSKAGLDNFDKIITSLPAEEKQTEQNKEDIIALQTKQALDSTKLAQEQEKLSQQQIKTQDVAAKSAQVIPTMPEQPAQPPVASPDDSQLRAALQNHGWSDEQINEYVNRLRSVA